MDRRPPSWKQEANLSEQLLPIEIGEEDRIKLDFWCPKAPDDIVQDFLT
jgi:hypothetical protein